MKPFPPLDPNRSQAPGAIPREIVEAALADAAEDARWRAAAHGHTLIRSGPDGELVEVDPGPPYVKKRVG